MELFLHHESRKDDVKSMPFAVKVMSRQAKSSHNHEVITRTNERFWVTEEPEGPTSSRVDGDKFPRDLKIFDTWNAAHDFAMSWRGHPWWCRPIFGREKIVEVKPVYRQELDGYVIA